jgi:hypothetical protein
MLSMKAIIIAMAYHALRGEWGGDVRSLALQAAYHDRRCWTGVSPHTAVAVGVP